MTSRSSSILVVAGVTVVGSILAYAAYFDYKRRNDVDFRKKLRKDKKRVDKSLAQSKESLLANSSPTGVTDAALREALEQVRNEEGPKTPEEKEAYFMSHVSMGEQLAVQGPQYYLPAAMSFYRALRVYPSPVELIVIYQKTVPEPVFKMVMDMTNLDVSSKSNSPSHPSQSLVDELTDEETSPTSGGPPSETSSQEWDKVKARVEGYYDSFPPKSTNVSVESREDGRKMLVVNKDFTPGEIIYKEQPIVTALDADLQSAGTYCTHCLRLIQSPMSIQLPEESNLLSSTFCSKVCLVANKTQSHSLLFTTEPPVPEIGGVALPASSIQARKDAQTKFQAYIKKEQRAAPLLVARFIARQVAMETSKMIEGGKKPSEKADFTDSEGGEYLLADHIERLRYLEVVPPKEELPLLVDVLQTALPGLEQFVTDERHTTLLGKMAYNAYGVCFGGGRDDKPTPSGRPEDIEKTRTPYGTSRQIGSALYTVSSYLTHSCVPSARPSFASGTAELHLIANTNLKKGDELTVAFVDVVQHEGESVAECRRRRRMELVRGWRFACGCQRCGDEAEEMSMEDKSAGETEPKDESKVEASLSRFEEREEGDKVE